MMFFHQFSIQYIIIYFLLELISDETDILFYIGSNLREIKRMMEACDDLIEETTKIDNSKEKILCDTLKYTDQLISSLSKIRDKCLIEIDYYKTTRGTM